MSVASSGWMSDRIPGATLTAVPGAGHALALTHWKRILAPVVREVS